MLNTGLTTSPSGLLSSIILKFLLSVGSSVVYAFENGDFYSSRPHKFYGGGEAEIEEEIVLDVKGMTCIKCEIAVQEALMKCDSVINVSAFYKDGTKWIKGVKGKIKVDELIKSVEKTGFSATIN